MFFGIYMKTRRVYKIGFPICKNYEFILVSLFFLIFCSAYLCYTIRQETYCAYAYRPTIVGFALFVSEF